MAAGLVHTHNLGNLLRLVLMLPTTTSNALLDRLMLLRARHNTNRSANATLQLHLWLLLLLPNRTAQFAHMGNG